MQPEPWQKTDISLYEQADKEFRQMLINCFVKNNRERVKEITDALNAGDIELAHRLAHSLKGNAAQLEKTLLQRAAAEVEKHLNEGKNLVTPEQIKQLQIELDAVIAEIGGLVQQAVRPAAAAEPMDSAAALELLGKLEQLLKQGNPDSLSFVDGLLSIPGSEELIQQIEELDFELALITLAGLKEKT
jgi:HPt (histidine-containing phosphotransfer) domain-containing protein